jgi:hypothetical protein
MAAPTSPGNIPAESSAIEAVANHSLASLANASAKGKSEESPVLSANEANVQSQALIQAEPAEAEAIHLLIRAETAPVSMVHIYLFCLNAFPTISPLAPP